MDNERRIANGKSVVKHYVKVAKAEDILYFSLIDMLTDLRHFCHKEGADNYLEEAIRISKGHFEEEILEEEA